MDKQCSGKSILGSEQRGWYRSYGHKVFFAQAYCPSCRKFFAVIRTISRNTYRGVLVPEGTLVWARWHKKR